MSSDPTAWFIISNTVTALFIWAGMSLRAEHARRIFVAPPPQHRSEVDEQRLVELVPAIKRQWDLLDEIVRWRNARTVFDEWWWQPAWLG